MAFDNSPGSDCWYPGVPISESHQPRLKISQFKEGWEQRMLDGINAMETLYTLTFEMRPAAVIREMIYYLRSRQGKVFNWYHPVDGLTRAVYCDSWTVDWEFRNWDANGVRKDFGTLTATFRVAYGEEYTIEGIQTGIGQASGGASVMQATGRATVAAVGVAHGSGAAFLGDVFIPLPINSAIGAAIGASSVTGVGRKFASAVGAAAGAGVAVSTAINIRSSVGVVSGASVVTAVGRMIKSGVGSATGIGTVVAGVATNDDGENLMGVNALSFAGADLGAKINAALNAGNLDIYVPNSSGLIISTPIQVRHACTLSFSNKYPDHIVCQTNGKPVFEAVGSVRHFRIKGGIFDGKTTTTPSCFLLVASDQAGHSQCGDTTAMSGVQCTGSWGMGVIVHLSAEIITYENCHLWCNDKGSSAYAGPYATVIMANMDYFSTPYQYTQPVTTARSMSSNIFQNCDIRCGPGASCFLLKGQVEDTTIIPSYLNTQGLAGITIEAGDIGGGSWTCPRRLRVMGGGRLETNGHASSSGCPAILIDGKSQGGQGIYELVVEGFGFFIGSTGNTTPVIKCQNLGVAYALTAFRGCHVESTSVLFQSTVSDLSWADIRSRFNKNIDCTGKTLDNCDIKILGSITAASAVVGNGNRLRSSNVNVG